MSTRDTSLGGSGREFPSTHWSRLLLLGDPSHPAFASTLNLLIAQYWKPAYHYVRALRSLGVEEAKDVTQDFFRQLLQRRSLEQLSADRGTFRGFLKTSLKYFLVSRDRARKVREAVEGGPSLPFDEAERDWARIDRETPAPTPDEAFDREWARSVLMEGIARLQQALTLEEKPGFFEVFRRYCLDPTGLRFSAGEPSAEVGSGVPPPYPELARQLGIGENDVRSRLRYARARLREIVAELVAGTVGPDGSVEAELREVLSR